MAVSLRDRVVIVTGASAGIGQETARAFARAGARVALAARRADRLEALANQINESGGEALAVPTDVSDPARVEALVARTLKRWGRLDIFVNNAGFGHVCRFEELTEDEIHRLVEVNLLGTLYGIQAALPIMRRQKSGHLITVSSIVGKRGTPRNAVYVATKFAQVGLTESLRVELAGSGIQASVICPVGTDTEFVEAMIVKNPAFRRYVRHGPIQSAARVAELIVRCAKHPRPEVYPYLPSRLLVVMNALAPRLVDRLLARFSPKLSVD
jgi:short-subunit dehydrogenase